MEVANWETNRKKNKKIKHKWVTWVLESMFVGTKLPRKPLILSKWQKNKRVRPETKEIKAESQCEGRLQCEM